MPGKIGDRIRCSFCNKTEDQVRKLIAGPGGVYICDECIDICSEIIEEELGEEYEEETLDAGEINLLKPAEIKKKLFPSQYIIITNVFLQVNEGAKMMWNCKKAIY